MARTAAGRAFARPLFPRGVYLAAPDRPIGVAERETDLRHPVPRRFPDLAGNRGRPEAAGRIHRLPRGASHLGSESAFAPAPALRRAGRRHLTGRLTLDRLPKVLLPPSLSRPQPPLSQNVLAATRTGFPQGSAPPLR